MRPCTEGAGKVCLLKGGGGLCTCGTALWGLGSSRALLWSCPFIPPPVMLQGV